MHGRRTDIILRFFEDGWKFANENTSIKYNTGLIWHTAVRQSVMAQLFILSYSDAVSFRDISGHLGTIPSIVTFYICACRRRRLIAGSLVGIPGNSNRTNLSIELDPIMCAN
jgi:hypothetical protein